jgi:hypothetical protein
MYRKSGNFSVKNFSWDNFWCKNIFVREQPYENILTMKMFKFRAQRGYSTYICRTVAIGRSKGIMYSLSPHYKDKTNPFVGEVRVAVRQGSPQCGRSILKKGIIIDRRTFTVKNDCSLYGGKYNRLHCNWGKKTSAKMAWKFLFFSQPVENNHAVHICCWKSFMCSYAWSPYENI